MPEITKIVITGGPCAGKTFALNHIRNFFSKHGFKVLIVAETATHLIQGGIAPWTCSRNVEYQIYHMQLQKMKEDIYYKAASNLNDEKVLIVCDRGLLDNKAYMNNFEFNEALATLNTSEIALKDSYDAVFHMESSSKGAPDFYGVDSNPIRKETVEEAKELDDKIISSWVGHPYYRIIPCFINFDDKVKKLINEISAFLGTPEHYEIERKYLIKYPNIEELNNYQYISKVDIVQTYLSVKKEEEIRIRKRGINNNYTYYKTYKKKISDVTRIEKEQKISEDEYNELLNSKKKLVQITKTRYCFVYKNQYFELDIYPFWDNEATMEIELSDVNQNIEFPPFIEIIKEISGNKQYSNSKLAVKYGSVE